MTVNEDGDADDDDDEKEVMRGRRVTSKAGRDKNQKK